MKAVSILGSTYNIYLREKTEDKYLEKCAGYCDPSSRTIVVMKESDDNELDDFVAYQKQILRHEIVHAFLYESGLGADWEHSASGHDETTVDWIARQMPLMYDTMVEAGAI